MKLKGITEKEMRLLIILFSLLIFVGVYQFIYIKTNDKTDTLTVENNALQVQVNELMIKQSNAEKLKDEITSMESEMKELINVFPSDITTEKGIMFAKELEDFTDISISSVAFSEKEVFYSSSGQAEQSETMDENSVENETLTDTTSEISTDNEANENTNQFNLGIQGIRSTVTLSYQTTYNGLKQCLSYIKENENRMVLNDLTAAYDMSTGNLTGSMTIAMYALIGSPKGYTAPDLDHIKTGTNNIFSTIEIPAQ
ncbi:MAG: hypothetical protein K0S41_2083 [Anaerocolumna sp.]|jgi:hypothetical protein|nr:hypothetical protein [Anaerocolumna sp.]